MTDQDQQVLNLTSEQIDAALTRIAADKAVHRTTDARIVAIAQLAETSHVEYKGILLQRKS